MKALKLTTAVASTCLSTSCLAGEPQTMLYLMVPFGQAPQFGVMLRPTDNLRLLPVLDFRLSYRPKADADASTAADSATNWWVVGGAVAAGAILIASDRRRKTPQDDPVPVAP